MFLRQVLGSAHLDLIALLWNSKVPPGLNSPFIKSNDQSNKVKYDLEPVLFTLCLFGFEDYTQTISNTILIHPFIKCSPFVCLVQGLYSSNVKHDLDPSFCKMFTLYLFGLEGYTVLSSLGKFNFASLAETTDKLGSWYLCIFYMLTASFTFFSSWHSFINIYCHFWTGSTINESKYFKFVIFKNIISSRLFVGIPLLFAAFSDIAEATAWYFLSNNLLDSKRLMNFFPAMPLHPSSDFCPMLQCVWFPLLLCIYSYAFQVFSHLSMSRSLGHLIHEQGPHAGWHPYQEPQQRPGPIALRSALCYKWCVSNLNPDWCLTHFTCVRVNNCPTAIFLNLLCQLYICSGDRHSKLHTQMNKTKPALTKHKTIDF